MTKLIYKATSTLEFIKFLLLRLGLMAAIIYLIFQYNENPILIVILITICFLFSLILGHNEIYVYEDRVEFITYSILRLLIKNKKRILYLRDIESFYLKEKPIGSLAELTIATALTMFLPKQHYDNNNIYFYAKFLNGKEVTLTSNFSYKKTNELIKALNKQINVL